MVPACSTPSSGTTTKGRRRKKRQAGCRRWLKAHLAFRIRRLISRDAGRSLCAATSQNRWPTLRLKLQDTDLAYAFSSRAGCRRAIGSGRSEYPAVVSPSNQRLAWSFLVKPFVAQIGDRCSDRSMQPVVGALVTHRGGGPAVDV